MTANGQNGEQSRGQEQVNREYVIHVGALALKYEASSVSANRILEDAGFIPPEEYVLEALRGAQGPAEQQFETTEQVPLNEPHDRHFRAVPRGGGRA